MSFLVAFLFLAMARSSVEGLCRVTSDRCDFPFIHENTSHTWCMKHDSLPDDHVCITQLDQHWRFGVCNANCFDDSEHPIEFTEESAAMAVFCRTEPLECVFPFKYKDVEYTECTTVDMEDPEVAWCATLVDENGDMVEHMWGKCECEPDPTVPEPVASQDVEGKVAEVKVDGDVSMEISFEQTSESEPLRVTGTVTGLSPGLHGFHVHEFGDTADECRAAGGHFNPTNATHGAPSASIRHTGDFGNIEADSEGTAMVDLTLSHASLFGENSIIGKTLVVHQDEDDLGMVGDAGSLAVGNAGARVACGIITDPSELDLTLIIIIVLVVIIVILLILIACLVCYCIKKKRSKRPEKSTGDDGLPLKNGDPKKRTPLYDELSIPFIDATPSHTPRTGRSTERLSAFFNRTPSIGRSRGSLSNDEQ